MFRASSTRRAPRRDWRSFSAISNRIPPTARPTIRCAHDLLQRSSIWVSIRSSATSSLATSCSRNAESPARGCETSSRCSARKRARPCSSMRTMTACPSGREPPTTEIGVATLLEIGAILKNQPLKRPVVLLFNEGEELGLVGARAFLDDPLSRSVDSSDQSRSPRRPRPGQHVRDKPPELSGDRVVRFRREASCCQFTLDGRLPADVQLYRRQQLLRKRMADLQPRTDQQ